MYSHKPDATLDWLSSWDPSLVLETPLGLEEWHLVDQARQDLELPHVASQVGSLELGP